MTELGRGKLRMGKIAKRSWHLWGFNCYARRETCPLYTYLACSYLLCCCHETTCPYGSKGGRIISIYSYTKPREGTHRKRERHQKPEKTKKKKRNLGFPERQLEITRTRLTTAAGIWTRVTIKMTVLILAKVCFSCYSYCKKTTSCMIYLCQKLETKPTAAAGRMLQPPSHSSDEWRCITSTLRNAASCWRRLMELYFGAQGDTLQRDTKWLYTLNYKF